MISRPAKVSFADPSHWIYVHRVRSSLPPLDGAELVDWIHLQHVHGLYDRLIGQGLDRVIRTHRGTSEAWMGVSGPPHLGKTDAVTSVLLERSMAAGRFGTKQATGHRHVPYVFVEASSNPTAKSVLSAVANFLGHDHRGDEEQLVRRLRPLWGPVGVQAVVIDEGQNFRRASAAATKTTDGLRRLTHLPVPVVFCGLDLDSSALLRTFHIRNDSVDQLRDRSQRVALKPMLDADGVAAIAEMLKLLGERLALIDRFRVPGLRDRTVVKDLIKSFDGRPGAILETVKEAASDVVNTDRILTADRLREAVGLRLPQRGDWSVVSA